MALKNNYMHDPTIYTSNFHTSTESQTLISKCLLEVFKEELRVVYSRIIILPATWMCNRHIKLNIFWIKPVPSLVFPTSVSDTTPFAPIKILESLLISPFPSLPFQQDLLTLTPKWVLIPDHSPLCCCSVVQATSLPAWTTQRAFYWVICLHACPSRLILYAVAE